METGEVGSINYYTQKAMEDPDYVAMMIGDKTQVALNVISKIEVYYGSEKALHFATKIIKLNGNS